ncbi:MAG: hypothetical protein JNJ55_06995, partial [Betaproteobacteria bacterium]|nr:hypothetical protein [Betaproteobacteria bacterium]
AALAGLALLLRATARSRDRGSRLSLQDEAAFVRSANEAASTHVTRNDAQHTAPRTSKAMPLEEPVPRPSVREQGPARPVTREAATPTNTLPVIEFELPPLDPAELPRPIAAPTMAAGLTPAPDAANAPNAPTTRRARFIKARYHDIAILNPPLDSPQRLLWQASTLYGEGAVDFAKRLLKFAAYSRQLTEEFWLALFELLYREKLANDFIVNARWFQTHHPRSEHWSAVQRVGYLLDPNEALFAEAAVWSSEEPAHGLWLPVPDSAPATTKFPDLKLELVG